MTAASASRPRSVFGSALTSYPSFSRRSTTPFQLDESAQAPWTSRMVGLVVCADAPAEAIAATERLKAHANPGNCENKPAIFMMLPSKPLPRLLDRGRQRALRRFDGPRILPRR